MKASNWEVRILFLLVLALLGTFAFGNHLYGLIGLGAGVAAIVIQMFIVRLPVDDILYSVIGCIIGLIFGLLVMVVLQSGISERDNAGLMDPLVLIPLVFAYIFSHVAVSKGRKLGYIPVEEEQSSTSKPILADLSAIIDGRIADMTLCGLLAGPFVLSSSLRSSIEKMNSSEDIIVRGQGRRGIETLDRLEEADGRAGGLVLQDFGKGEKEQIKMLEYLHKEAVTLLSGNSEFIKKARKEGIHVIDLNEVGPAARPVILPGAKFEINLVRKGRNKNQSVGFLDDGTMVVVERSENKIGKSVLVTAHTTFRSSGGTMVFAALEGIEENIRDTGKQQKKPTDK